MSYSQDDNPYAAPLAPPEVPEYAPLASAGEPRGIRGWLILPFLSLLLTPIRIGWELVRDFLPAFSYWHELTTVGSPAYHPLWKPLILFELLVNIGFMLFTLVLLYFFIRKSRLVPRLFIIWLLAHLAMLAIDQVLCAQIPALVMQADEAADKELVRSVMSAAIWVPYFLRSKRVKNTFIEP